LAIAKEIARKKPLYRETDWAIMAAIKKADGRVADAFAKHVREEILTVSV